MIDPVGATSGAVSGIGASQITGGAAPVRGAQASAAADVQAAPDFGAALAEAALNAASVLKTGEATSIAGIRGQASVQQVVEAVMAAEQTLQSSIAIRDKVVAAYLEISRMQI
jgi:flagellar hook-basal body complex protein FliE